VAIFRSKEEEIDCGLFGLLLARYGIPWDRISSADYSSAGGLQSYPSLRCGSLGSFTDSGPFGPPGFSLFRLPLSQPSRLRSDTVSKYQYTIYLRRSNPAVDTDYAAFAFWLPAELFRRNPSALSLFH
jgi:hypothetical protein